MSTDKKDQMGSIIHQQFPNVEWTGSSIIHRSIAIYFKCNMPINSRAGIIRALEHVKIGFKVWDLMHDSFGKMEWLVSPQGLHAIAMSDLNRSLLGLSDVETKSKLKNPVTGSVFNRVAVLGDIVAGPRFWAEACTNDESKTEIYFRFRLNGIDEVVEKTRERTRERTSEAEKEVETLLEEFGIKEPNEEEREHARSRVRQQV